MSSGSFSQRINGGIAEVANALAFYGQTDVQVRRAVPIVPSIVSNVGGLRYIKSSDPAASQPTRHQQ